MKISQLMNIFRVLFKQKEGQIFMGNIRADFGIINFWWCDDHGAILTAFALQQFLKGRLFIRIVKMFKRL